MCKDCEVETRKHCDVCGGYGSNSDEEECDDCEGKCQSNETETCENCAVKLRIGCANNPSDESIFNGLCDACREEEEMPTVEGTPGSVLPPNIDNTIRAWLEKNQD